MEAEREMIREALRSSGSIGAAARILGINPKTLYTKKLKYGISNNDERQATRKQGNSTR